MQKEPAFTITPLSKERWPDFEALLGPKGAYGGCWCMLWRLTKADFDRDAGDRNRQAMKALAESDRPPGLLAYDKGRPVGWISVAPRRTFVRLESSRVLKPVDDEEVWSVSCFLIAKSHRKQGLGIRLLKAACDFVREQGGTILEGYPIAPTKRPYPAAYAWTGFASVFTRTGFEEVARRSETRPIMRRNVAKA